MQRGGNVKRSVLILFVGIIITFGLFIWYKQYSYRSLKIYSLNTNYEESMRGDELNIHGHYFEYKESRCFDGHWFKCDYYKAIIKNNNNSDIYISYRYKSDEKHNFILRPKEEVILDYSRSDLIDIYGLSDEVTNTFLEVNNYDYMNQLKQVIKGLLVISLIFTVILSCLSYILKNYSILKKVLCVSLTIFVVVSFLVTFCRLYPFIYIACEYLAVLTGILMTLLFVNKDQHVEAKPVEKLIYLSIIGMGLIYFIFSQMLNGTSGWITYFAAWNQKAVFDYALLNVLLFTFIILGLLITKKYQMLDIKAYFSSKEFLYSISCIELILFFPLTSWRKDLSLELGIVLVLLEILLVYLYRLNVKTGFIKDIKNRKITDVFCIVIEGILIVATVVNNVQINYWGTGRGDVYHCSWYYGNIYEVGYNLQLPGGDLEAYGHFMLFYKIPMIIFGNSLLVVGITTIVVMFISLLCIYISSHLLIKNKVLRIGFDLCLFICFTLNFAYPMNVPHRVFFPSIMLLYMVLIYDNFNQLKKYLGYFICVLSVLWCTEAGLICCIAYIVYISLLKLKCTNKISTLIFVAMRNIFLIPFSIIISYIIVQIYHFIALRRYCSDYSINDFLGVLVDKDNLSAGQFNTFYFENSQWMYYWILFVVFLVYGFYKVGIFGELKLLEKHKYNMVISIISIYGLGFMVIIMSRPENYTLVVVWALLLGFSFLDKLSNNRSWTNVSKMLVNMRVLIIIPMIVLIANIFVLVPDAVGMIKTNIVDYQRFNYKAVKDGEKELEKYPLEDVYAVGNGIKMLYFDMGCILENGNGGLAPEGAGQVDELMNQTTKKYILTDMGMSNPNYEKVEDIKISNYIYTIYQRK